MHPLLKKLFFFVFVTSTLAVAVRFPSALGLQSSFKEKTIPSLKTIPVPGPSDEMLAQFVADKKAAIQLGKALFWDQKVGSDNKVACATCHFHAGADNRVKNQMNPGELAGDEKFNIGGPNYTLTKKNFPFTVFPAEDDEQEQKEIPTPLADTNDVSGSQGVHNRTFVYIEPDGEADECKTEDDSVFHARYKKTLYSNTRRIEQRNTPSIFNAVFNFRNFWDGRATNVFNGIDPFGNRSEESYVWKVVGGNLQKVTMKLPTSALASQASGPPLSGFEMSCKQRLFHHIGKKLVNQKILDQQTISATDSVLGELATTRPLYSDLIKKAFKSEYWSAESVPYGGARPGSMDLIDPPIFGRGRMIENIPQIEANFALFFGMAIQLYESTLVSDDSPFDKFAEGNLNALTDQQKRGFEVFKGQGACIRCHTGAEFTSASFSSVNQQRLLKVPLGTKMLVVDNGFFNIGVRPTTDDIGVGGVDPYGKPMSETMMVKNHFSSYLGNDFDPTRNPTPAEITDPVVAGAFKVPSLRNVELTGPYFHNGGKTTLKQVVELYDRGGDFTNEGNTLVAANFTPQQEEDLIAFLLSLTDERVRYKRAPFDHPSLCFPHGHTGNSTHVFDNGEGNAKDIMECIPAVGAQGVSFKNRVKPFLNLSPFSE